MATKQLSYTAAQIDAAIAKINSLILHITANIVQLYDGSTAIYPRTQAEAVFFDGDPTKTLADQMRFVKEGYLYKGIVTPSTVPNTPLGKIFYLTICDDGYVYERFLNDGVILSVPKGISVIYWDGSRWFAEQLINIDNYPTEGSNSIAKSGGIKVQLDTLVDGVKVSIGISPSVIYKGIAQSITLTGIMENNKAGVPIQMKLFDGTTILAESTTSPIVATPSINISDNSKEYRCEGIIYNLTFKGKASVNARYPIYYGFGVSASQVAVDANKYPATTSASHTYERTSTIDNTNFFILIPSDISGLSSFTMGGAPFVMDPETTETIGGIVYKVYKSAYAYNANTTLKVSAS